MLLDIFYVGCVKQARILREELPLRVFENTVLRVGQMAPVGEIRSAYRILVGKPDGWRPLGRCLRRRRMDIVKMNLREIEWDFWNGFTAGTDFRLL
jgi:hypothetical protein